MEENEVQKLQEELERLRTLVYFDELTGLLNRRGFMEEAEREFQLVSFGKTELERRTGFEIPFAIIFLDLDNFKSINDTYGHQGGDEALKTAATVLKQQLRDGDLLGRWGGEEFVVAVLGANQERTLAIAEKLRKSIEQANVTVAGGRIPLTASIGVASYRNTGTLQDLIDVADKAMYQAKETGKNRVTVFESK